MPFAWYPLQTASFLSCLLLVMCVKKIILLKYNLPPPSEQRTSILSQSALLQTFPFRILSLPFPRQHILGKLPLIRKFINRGTEPSQAVPLRWHHCCLAFPSLLFPFQPRYLGRAACSMQWVEQHWDSQVLGQHPQKSVTGFWEGSLLVSFMSLSFYT